MRSQEQMMDLILQTALDDERVRAVCMNGSRVNKNAPRDLFQDYDVVYLVTRYQSFLDDLAFIDRFGERTVMQLPDLPDGGAAKRFHILMQFTDGNRIDLTILALEFMEDYLKEDTLTVALLDKDGLLPALPEPNDSLYWVKRPTAEQFAACCNEFWWVAPYVAKGLWRGELLYAVHHLEACLRRELLTMLEWEMGCKTGFTVSMGKYLDRYLEPERYQALLGTCNLNDIDNCWGALFSLARLFGGSARRVALQLGFSYQEREEERVAAHLKRVRELPPNASDFGKPLVFSHL